MQNKDKKEELLYKIEIDLKCKTIKTPMIAVYDENGSFKEKLLGEYDKHEPIIPDSIGAFYLDYCMNFERTFQGIAEILRKKGNKDRI